MRPIRAISLTVVITALFVAGQANAANPADFTPYNFDENGKTILRGQLHVPAEYAADRKQLRPLIIFLHGSGEAGTDNLAQINGNIDNLLSAAKAHGAFLYAPQSEDGSDATGWRSAAEFSHAMMMIERAVAERSVDPNRIYPTGVSLGGGGVWNMLSEFPDRFAAAVPISTSELPETFETTSVAHIPIWAFHARNDTVVPVKVTRDLIDGLLSEAGQPLPIYPASDVKEIVTFDYPSIDVHYSEYPGDHGIWPEVYKEPKLYDWLFAHTKAPR